MARKGVWFSGPAAVLFAAALLALSPSPRYAAEAECGDGPYLQCEELESCSRFLIFWERCSTVGYNYYTKLEAH